jgi:hypothetical protein
MTRIPTLSDPGKSVARGGACARRGAISATPAFSYRQGRSRAASSGLDAAAKLTELGAEGQARY